MRSSMEQPSLPRRAYLREFVMSSFRTSPRGIARSIPREKGSPETRNREDPADSAWDEIR